MALPFCSDTGIFQGPSVKNMPLAEKRNLPVN